jgi:twinkle protein
MDAPVPSTRGTKQARLLIDQEYLSVVAIPGRGLTEEACKAYGYAVAHDVRHPVTKESDVCRVAPYYRDNALIAQKLKFPDKTYISTGDGRDLPLFGSHKWHRGSRIVITEGEEDAISVAQVTGLKMASVSLPSGATSAHKSIKASLDYLANFDTVVLWFDADDPGRKAIADCVELFEPGKVLIARTPPNAKDANDLLKQGRVKELIDAVYQAKPWRPDNLVSPMDLKDRVRGRYKDLYTVPWGYECLDRRTRGIRVGEVVTVAAGAAAGKSTLIREIQYSMIQTGEPFAAFMLEDMIEDAVQSLVSLHMGQRIHMREDVQAFVETEEWDKAYTDLFDRPGVYLYDNRGTLTVESLEQRIRAAVRMLGVRWIYLDNITSMMATAKNEDERRLIDAVLMSMANLTKELGIGIIVVCHLRRPEGEKGYEDGKEITANALRGSGGILAFSNTVIALERNQRDVDTSTHIKVRVLKCRWTGDTEGVAGTLVYDKDTGRVVEIPEMEASL